MTKFDFCFVWQRSTDSAWVFPTSCGDLRCFWSTADRLRVEERRDFERWVAEEPNFVETWEALSHRY